MKQLLSRVPPVVGPAAQPAAPAARGFASAADNISYLVSSFELRAGLDVAVLCVAQLPAEVLRELQRLHGSWQQGHAR